jgi:hypothetical protein
MQGPSHGPGVEKVAMQARMSQGNVGRSRSVGRVTRDSMQGIVVRLLIGAGMMILALIFTGMLAVEPNY